MALEKIQLEHIPPTYQVYAAFFRDVTNTEFLHTQLLSRNSEFEYAFVDASAVISRLQLLSAVYSSLNALIVGALRTPNVHSEIVVSLSTNNNVPSPKRPFPQPTALIPTVRPDFRSLPKMGNNARQNQRPDRRENRPSASEHARRIPAAAHTNPNRRCHLGPPNNKRQGHASSTDGHRARPGNRLGQGPQVLPAQRRAGAGSGYRRGRAQKADRNAGRYGYGVARAVMITRGGQAIGSWTLAAVAIRDLVAEKVWQELPPRQTGRTNKRPVVATLVDWP